MTPRIAALAATLGLLLACAPREAAGQNPYAILSPSCTEQGISRVVASVPPGRDRESFKAAIQRGEVFPQGTEALLLPAGQGPHLRNREQMDQESTRTLRRLLDRDIKVDGRISVLVSIGDDGKVREVTPNTGNRDLDRTLQELWVKAVFDPPVISGCRVATYYHVPVAFSSDFSLTRQEVQMSTGANAEP